MWQEAQSFVLTLQAGPGWSAVAFMEVAATWQLKQFLS
jgi:hypothetical protein